VQQTLVGTLVVDRVSLLELLLELVCFCFDLNLEALIDFLFRLGKRASSQAGQRKISPWQFLTVLSHTFLGHTEVPLLVGIPSHRIAFIL